MLKLKTPLRFTLIEHDPETGNRSILSIKDIEWRYILVHERLNLNIELESLKHQAGGSLGVLKLEVFVEKLANPELSQTGGTQTFLKTRLKLIDETVLQDQLDKEKEDTAIKIKQFFEYS